MVRPLPDACGRNATSDCLMDMLPVAMLCYVCRYNSTSWFERDELLAALNDPAAWSTDLIGSGFVLEQV